MQNPYNPNPSLTIKTQPYGKHSILAVKVSIFQNNL